MLPLVLRRAGLVLVVLLVALAGLASPAAAAPLLAADTTSDVVLSVPWTSLVVSQAIPLVVALVANASASSALKASLNVLLSALGAALTVVVDNGGSAPLVEVVGAFLVVVTASQVGHRLIWSHVGEPGIRDAVPGGLG